MKDFTITSQKKKNFRKISETYILGKGTEWRFGSKSVHIVDFDCKWR